MRGSYAPAVDCIILWSCPTILAAAVEARIVGHDQGKPGPTNGFNLTACEQSVAQGPLGAAAAPSISKRTMCSTELEEDA